MDESIAKKYVILAKKIVLEHLSDQPVQIFLFDSRANNTAHRHSDIDIAFLVKKPIKSSIISYLREALEESAIPYAVDLVDLSDVSEGFKHKVISEGISWQG